MNRGKHEIYRDVLVCCRKAEVKSQLMRKCRISWSQTKQILPFLINKGFLETATEKRSDRSGNMKLREVYQTTQKGAVLLTALENVDFILKTEYAKNLLKCRCVTNAIM